MLHLATISTISEFNAVANEENVILPLGSVVLHYTRQLVRESALHAESGRLLAVAKRLKKFNSNSAGRKSCGI